MTAAVITSVSLPKSSRTAAVLAIGLGATGAHNFYLARPVEGIAQLTVFIFALVCGLIGLEGIVLAGLAIWVLSDAVRIHHGIGSYRVDGWGQPLVR